MKNLSKVFIITATFLSLSVQATEVEMKEVQSTDTAIESNLNNGTWALGGNYTLSLQDPDGDFSSQKINLDLAVSYYSDLNNEFGVYLGYGHSKIKVTTPATESESDITKYGVFYRYNFLLSHESALYPLSAYVGAQAGAYTVNNSIGSTTTNDTNGSAGGQFGLNWALSQEFALNLHLLQFDSIFKNSQTVISQSVGVKYFF